MGAADFCQVGRGKTAKEAFQNAREEAQYESGHGGYTGTVAEKHDFVMIQLPEGKGDREYAWELIDNGDKCIEDKWGPAGCIKIKEGEYLFFGWASC